jgi:uncharacterized protein YcbK (DUF882 family)
VGVATNGLLKEGGQRRAARPPRFDHAAATRGRRHLQTICLRACVDAKFPRMKVRWAGGWTLERRLLLALIGSSATVVAEARAFPRPPAPRRLQLVHAHTGETYQGTYRDDRGPIPRALDELCIFLRDHHCGAVCRMDIGVIDFLADVLDAVGVPKATILSAYRTRSTNDLLARTTFGVAEYSQHIYGRALDFHVDQKLAEAAAAARAARRGGVGWYPNSGFIHIDTGPVRNWTLGQRGLARLLDFDPQLLRIGPRGELTIGPSQRPLTPSERLALHRQLARARGPSG